ncbi:MAG: hypothetical protein M3P11_05090 [Actinomycetota bacterium]|nr:hypothetical protein [Actinomycetota bacterium]
MDLRRRTVLSILPLWNPTTSLRVSLAALGEPAARELLDVLTRSDVDRAALIGRLHQRVDARWLAEVLMELESDPDDITRM